MGIEGLDQIKNDNAVDSLLDSLALICRLYGVATSKDALVAGLPLRNGKMTPACWRAFKNDHLCALNFDQAFMGVDYYTAVDKSTRLTGSAAPLFVH